ncbi:MAG TPA: zf-HC2 domain-containing protein [Bacteroidota bacterium]|nr:zf-HC2 domain-containing protein [Bacteroidota bacterium]
MISCEQFRDLAPSALYHELTGSDLDQFEEHRRTCSGCSALYDGMASTVTFMNRRRVDEPGDAYWSGYADRVMDGIRKTGPARKVIFLPLPQRIPRWAYGIAALLLIAAGIYLGRSWFAPGNSVGNQAASLQTNREAPDSVAAMVASYLDRSKNILLGVVNGEPDAYSPELLASQQRASRELLDRGVVIKAALNRPDQQQLRQLIQSLEVILLQLANIDIRPGVPMVELVKDGISKNSILLRINMQEMKNNNHPVRKTGTYHSSSRRVPL